MGHINNRTDYYCYNYYYTFSLFFNKNISLKSYDKIKWVLSRQKTEKQCYKDIVHVICTYKRFEKKNKTTYRSIMYAPTLWYLQL